MTYEQNFRQEIINFPKQFILGAQAAASVKSDKKFGKIILCGMGGSNLPAEILMTFCEVSNIPSNNLFIHRDYEIPTWTSTNDLVICISWSGNTAETISSYQAAITKNIPAVAITQGGKLGELAKNQPLISLPQSNIQPRNATGFMFSALLTFLINSSIIKIEESKLLDRFSKLESTLQVETLEQKGKKLAQKISGFTPIIYSSYKWRSLALSWKVNFNENAKIHSFWNHFPGTAHNEILGFESKNQKFFPILISDQKEGGRQLKKLRIATKLFGDLKVNHEVINLYGEGTLEKIFNNYLLASWTSYFTALNLKMDPASIKLIDKFKELEKTA
jgi:glucose/mannose-6-phosphate isomerase